MEKRTIGCGACGRTIGELLLDGGEPCLRVHQDGRTIRFYGGRAVMTCHWPLRESRQRCGWENVIRVPAPVTA